MNILSYYRMAVSPFSLRIWMNANLLLLICELNGGLLPGNTDGVYFEFANTQLWRACAVDPDFLTKRYTEHQIRDSINQQTEPGDL